jgi:S-sulfo-L-cysteine synthase (3-phospho-L-serine-dependent)
MLFRSVVDAIGHTPLVRLRFDSAPEVDVFAKLELQNLFAMKDRVARKMILAAKRLGVLADGAAIVESSSGTMALGVALVGTALGHPVHIVTDPRIDRITMAKLRALGCEVHVVPVMTSHGWQSARLERLAELLHTLPGAFWPQQYSNPDNPAAYGTLATELVDDLERIDVLVGSVGSGGSLCGTARALREVLPDLRVVGVDCVGSALFGQPDRPQRLQSGLGNSLRPKNLDHREIDEVHWLNDREAFTAARELAREQQIFGGNTSGSVYRVLGDVAARAQPGSQIVGIFPDRGDRYTDSVYDDDYSERHQLAELPLAQRAEPVDPGAIVTSWSRTEHKAGDYPRHLLFVESNTTGTGMLALAATHDLNLRPVLLTSASARYRGLGEAECEVIECDTNSIVALRSTIQERFRRQELSGITTTSEYYVQVVADLADWLGLPGNTAIAVAACRNKATTRQALAATGMSQPRFGVVTDAAAVRETVDRVGLPCVVKPADDSGSNDVLRCADLATAVAQVERVLATRTNVRGLPTARTALVEEYLVGPELSVETFHWRGVTHVVGITAKSVIGEPFFVEHRHVFPADLPPDVELSVRDTVERALAVVGLRLGAVHTEVKLTSQDPMIVEINARLAGGMIPELVRLATGIRMLDQQLRVFAGLPPVLVPETKRYAGIQFLLADRPGVLLGVTGVDRAAALPGVERVVVTVPDRAVVRPAQNAYDRIGYVIATGDTPGQLSAALTDARSALGVVIGGERP